MALSVARLEEAPLGSVVEINDYSWNAPYRYTKTKLSKGEIMWVCESNFNGMSSRSIARFASVDFVDPLLLLADALKEVK